MSIWKQECLFTEGTDCWVSWYRHRTVAHIEMWPNKAPSGIKSHLWRQCNYMACFKPCNFRIWKIAPFILGTRAQTFNLLSWNARCRNRKTLSPWQIASFIVILWHWKCPPPFKPVFKAHFPDISHHQAVSHDTISFLICCIFCLLALVVTQNNKNPKEAIVKLWNVTVETKFPLQRKYSHNQQHNFYWDFLIKMNMITR